MKTLKKSIAAADAVLFALANIGEKVSIKYGDAKKLPDCLTHIGGNCYLSDYAHPLPAGLRSIGGYCHLGYYAHPLPAGLRSVGGYCHLGGYAHPLPAGLVVKGRIIK